MEERIARTVAAWETLRPARSFGGLTLAQFKERMQPSVDARAALRALDSQLVAAQNVRDDADTAAGEVIALVVNAVKGDPAEGEDGELYEAMGYVRKSERASGLRRGAPTPTPAAA
jgi:hypothetical protein